jgi:hypothetical protein
MYARDSDILSQIDFFMAMEAMDRRIRCTIRPRSADHLILPLLGFMTASGDKHIRFFCSAYGLLHKRSALRQDQRLVPLWIAKLLSYRKVQSRLPADRKKLLAHPATQDDVAAVAAVIRAMPSRHAAGPDGLTYKMFKPLLEIPSLLEVTTESISTLLTPYALAILG